MKHFGSASENLILEFENFIGVKLPYDYYTFLLKSNGGFPTKNSFLINDKQGSDIVDLFYGLKTPKSYADAFEIFVKKRNDFPTTVIAIGEDPGGNYICMSLNDEDYGKIYFWDHEVPNEGSDGKPNYDNMYLIANSFTEFINSLH